MKLRNRLGNVWRWIVAPILVVPVCEAPPTPPATFQDVRLHVFNRLGYGPTPSLLANHTTLMSLRSWVQGQLSPTTSDPSVSALLPLLGLPTTQNSGANLNTMHRSQFLRALMSDWQLRERMTAFWNVHFNRSHDRLKFFDGFINGGNNGDDNAAYFMLADDQYYRDHAFGSFRDLLGYTAGSVSMLIYLDNYLSTAAENNQNWGRELLELFTMGRDNASTGLENYTQEDVVSAAKCFTGWTVSGVNGNHVSFIPDTAHPTHDAGPKVMFNATLNIPAGGTAAQDGTALLDYLAGAEATKDYVVRKLMRFFYGEDAPGTYPQVLSGGKAAWGAQGDMRAVLVAILTGAGSPLFTAETQWSKTKEPLHFAVSMARSAGAVPSDFPFGPPAQNLLDHLTMPIGFIAAAGQRLFNYPTPEGYPDDNEQQVSVSGMGDRLALAELTIPSPALFQFTLNMPFESVVLAGLAPPATHDPAAVTDFLLREFFGDKPIPAADRNMVLASLAGIPGLQNELYAEQIRRAVTLIWQTSHACVF